MTGQLTTELRALSLWPEVPDNSVSMLMEPMGFSIFLLFNPSLNLNMIEQSLNQSLKARILLSAGDA